MQPRYFGTDGIRGRVGEYPINELFCWRMGHALARFLLQNNHSKRLTVVVGRDTRSSGKVFERYLQASLQSHAITVYSLGTVPTPAVSKAVRKLSADLGIVVTASHNPACDNGIKLFDHRGLKFSIAEEIEIERFMEDGSAVACKAPALCEQGSENEAAPSELRPYVDQLRSMLPSGCLKGWTVVLDTANGATIEASPAVLSYFGADVIQLGDAPDGHNINADVGSECPGQLVATVKSSKARIGIAHDGDGDRLIVCDETGSVLAGEEVLGVIALDAIERKTLKKNTLVTTVHSNMGLDKAIQSVGGHVERVAVGDRNILLCMLEAGYNMGGESSGHFIFFDDAVTGDGLLAAIKVIEIMLRTELPLSHLRKRVKLFPQVSRHLTVEQKRPLEQYQHMQAVVREIEDDLGHAGRLLIRYSGTEPKLRLLVEGEDPVKIAEAMERLVAAVQCDFKMVE